MVKCDESCRRLRYQHSSHSGVWYPPEELPVNSPAVATRPTSRRGRTHAGCRDSDKCRWTSEQVTRRLRDSSTHSGASRGARRDCTKRERRSVLLLTSGRGCARPSPRPHALRDTRASAGCGPAVCCPVSPARLRRPGAELQRKLLDPISDRGYHPAAFSHTLDAGAHGAGPVRAATLLGQRRARHGPAAGRNRPDGIGGCRPGPRRGLRAEGKEAMVFQARKWGWKRVAANLLLSRCCRRVGRGRPRPVQPRPSPLGRRARRRRCRPPAG